MIYIIGLSIMTPTIIVIIFFITSLHKKGPDFVWHIDGYDKLSHMDFLYLVVVCGQCS